MNSCKTCELLSMDLLHEQNIQVVYYLLGKKALIVYSTCHTHWQIQRCSQGRQQSAEKSVTTRSFLASLRQGGCKASPGPSPRPTSGTIHVPLHKSSFHWAFDAFIIYGWGESSLQFVLCVIVWVRIVLRMQTIIIVADISST